MQSTIKTLSIFLLGALLLIPVIGCQQQEKAEAPEFDNAFVNEEFSTYPGMGKTVKPARATWNSGFILEAIYARALEHMGYEVEKYKEISGPIFYQSLVDGELDFWANGWFPLHNKMLPDNFNQKAQKVGYIVKNGAVQGYLASKDLVEKYNIKTLADFKRQEVIDAFDVDNDGKAEMVGCPPGWGCHKIITYHMKKAYPEIFKNIDVTTGAYSASMSSEVAKYKTDKPVFFYTWTPNWTVNKLKPGEDVMWIGVPEIKPTPEQQQLPNPTKSLTASGIEGAVTDPIKMGFAANDIRVVANKKFLENHPDVKKLFEIMSIPFADITAQNQKMFEGENTQKDVERHATQWIKDHKQQWIEWQRKAREAAK